MKSLRHCAVVACSFAVARAFRSNPALRSGGSILDQTSSAPVGRTSRSSDQSSVRLLPLYPRPARLRNSPSFENLRKTRVPRWLSSRTVDVDVIDVIDVTEEERRKEREQDDTRATGASRGRGRSRTEVAQDVRNLLDEAVHIIRDAGPQAVGARGIRASRAILLTLGDLAQELREGRLLRQRSVDSGSTTPKGRFSTDTAASTLSTQELDPAGAARALRLLFERLGATYIKLGQFIASSPTLFPAEYVTEFQKCLDATEPVSYSRILSIVKEELGGAARVNEEFRYIDPQPLASASVAQVHRAKLRTGEDVVLKVRKPGVEGTLQADLGFLYVGSRLLEILQPELGRTSFSAIVSDVRTAMLEELDFRKEASNIKTFTDFLGRAGITDAVAPKVYENLSSERLLVMERFKGVPLTDMEGIRGYSSNPEATLITALNTWSMSVMMAESFHADVHAGNLLVLEDGRVGFIDFGIVGRIPERVWASLSDLSEGFVSRDYRLMAASLVKMGAADGEVHLGSFALDIERVIEGLGSMETQLDASAIIDETGTVSYDASINLDQEAVTRLLLDIVGVAENNGLKLPREFGLLIKQALYFDRYTRLLAPDLDPIRDDRVTLPNGAFVQ